jgi:MSHA biogenesis protein MshJ
MSALKGIQTLRERVDARTQRERLLLAGAVAVVVLLVWELAFRAPLSRTRSQLNEEAQSVWADTANLRSSLSELERKVEQARGAGDKRRLEQLRERVTELDETLQQRTRRLISPKQMVGVVRAMVDAEEKLTLVSLTNKPVETVIEQAAVSEAGQPVSRVYRHGVEVVIEGDYFAVLRYLRRLENLDWPFDWRDLEVARGNYPTTRATISLATLSLEEDWIGV